MVRTFLAAVVVVGLVTLASDAGAQAKAAAPASAKAGAATGTVNINTASAADLQRLPGIGAKTATRVIAYRQQNGPFKKVEELMNVRGIGEKNFLKLKAQISVGTQKPDAPAAPR